MHDELSEWENAREKAFLILSENDFFKTINQFFEACDGYIIETSVPGGNRWSNRVYLHGSDFIRFLKNHSAVSDFMVNGSSKNDTCCHTVGFSEDFVCEFSHLGLQKKITFGIEDLNYKGSWYSGTFNFKLDDALVYSGECSTVDTGTGRGKIVLKEQADKIKSAKLSKEWVLSYLPKLAETIGEARASNEEFETKKLEKKRQKELEDSFDIGDFE